MLTLIRDQITGAPDNGWTMLGMIGGAAAAALIYGIVQLVKAWRRPEPSEIAVGGVRYDTTGMSESLVNMLSDALHRNADHETKITEQGEQIRHLESEQDSLRTVNLNQHRQLVVIKPAFRTATTWIDAGPPWEPPGPHIPDEARQALEIDPANPHVYQE